MSYNVHIKVWGPWACFTRPEMKVERVSYPTCTPSAARGILEAIFWEPQLYYTISQIAIVKKGTWSSVRRNEIQEIISKNSVKSWMTGSKPFKPVIAGGGAKDGTQRNMLALRDVSYIISAEVATTALAHRPGDTAKKYVSELKRRAQLGKCYHRPALGMREFAADFDLVQDLEAELAHTTTTYEEDLGIMLYDVFSPKERPKGFMWNPHSKNKKDRYQGHMVQPKPCYFKAKITNSVLKCHPDELDIIYPHNTP